MLAALAQSANIALVRPPAPEEEPDRLTAAVRALAEAGRRAAPFVLVPADPLAGVAGQWRAMWDLSAGTPGAAGFEAAAAEALAAWRAGRFELPDYYLSLTPSTRRGHRPGPVSRPAAGGPAAPGGGGAHRGGRRAGRRARSGRRCASCRTARGGRRWTSCSGSARTFFAGSLGGSGVAPVAGASFR